MIRSHARALAAAVRLLTVIPLPAGAASDAELGRSPLYYPLVGLALGGVLAGLCAMLDGAPAAVAAFVVLTVWVLVTGALHLDGLADCADGLLGGHGDPARTRRIMKDPHTGVAGVVAIGLLLLGKYSALVSLMQAGQAGVIWIVPVLGRAAILALMLALPYTSPGGLGAAAHAGLARGAARASLAIALLAGLWWAPLGVLGGIALLGLWGYWLRRRLGGATGDAYGAAVEGVEWAALLLLALQAP